jgi:hypothetical protein
MVRWAGEALSVLLALAWGVLGINASRWAPRCSSSTIGQGKIATMAATNKCLAQSDKSRMGRRSDEEEEPPMNGYQGA